MPSIAKAISISLARFHCNRLTTVQDIQDYGCLIFGFSVPNLIRHFPRNRSDCGPQMRLGWVKQPFLEFPSQHLGNGRKFGHSILLLTTNR